MKGEINCIELEFVSDEDSYIQYTVEADNKLMGQAFKKKFDKTFKAALAKLTND